MATERVHAERHGRTLPTRGLRVIVAGSGGGHVRQLLDLEPVWGRYRALMVTEDTALGRSLGDTRDVAFVSHFALGQARLGAPWRMLRGAIRNFAESWRNVRAFRPDVVISTGAGAMFWTVLAARLMGARYILIDSFARFDKPSKFARLSAWLAYRVVVQSERLSSWRPDAAVFDPLVILDRAPPPKRALAFATVGATLPFPRLVDTVLALKRAGQLPEDLVLQIGDGDAPSDVPPGTRIVRTLPFDEVKALLADAALIVCHGGTGSLITGLQNGCKVVAIPRRFDLGEHYDDHQEEICAAFAERGLIEVAVAPEDLGPAVARARGRGPLVATTDPVKLKDYLADLLDRLDGKGPA